MDRAENYPSCICCRRTGYSKRAWANCKLRDFPILDSVNLVVSPSQARLKLEYGAWPGSSLVTNM